jgi:hypothetical protein
LKYLALQLLLNRLLIASSAATRSMTHSHHLQTPSAHCLNPIVRLPS